MVSLTVGTRIGIHYMVDLMMGTAIRVKFGENPIEGEDFHFEWRGFSVCQLCCRIPLFQLERIPESEIRSILESLERFSLTFISFHSCTVFLFCLIHEKEIYLFRAKRCSKKLLGCTRDSYLRVNS